MSTIKMFLKFGNYENTMDLYNNGTIYMNSIEFFRKKENDLLRGDSYEGATSLRNFPAGQFTVESIGYKGNYAKFHLKESQKEVLGNIYCLYSISSQWLANPLDFKFDSRVREFGDYCLMVKDNVKFLSLIENGLASTGNKFHHDFVDYYNKNEINGPINLFQKSDEFKYQNEFRVYIETDFISPFSFQIGSLVNIAEVVETDAIMDLKMIANNGK